MRFFLDGLYRVSGNISAVFIAAICALVFAQVILNVIDRLSSLMSGTAIGLSIPSYADFAGYFLAAASFFALAYTFRECGHIRVTLLIQHTSPVLRRAIEFWCVGVVTAVAAYFTWYTALLVHESFIYNDLSSGMIPVPIWIPQLAVLTGLAVLLTALVDEFLGLVTGKDPSYQDKGENLLESEEPKPDLVLDDE